MDACTGTGVSRSAWANRASDNPCGRMRVSNTDWQEAQACERAG